MKKILTISLFLSFMLFFSGLMAQDTQQSVQDKKKLEKEEKKKQKQEADLADFNKVKTMAESQSFVFTAAEMFTAEGSASLNPRTNFFYVIGDEATLQFAFEGLQYIPNPNGLGGVTSKGTVTKYTYKADNPNKPVSIQVTVKPLAGQGQGIHQLVVTIYGDGYAELLMQSSGIRVKGSIERAEDSNIYEGTQN